ncbi:trypsin-like peptidase domain protein [Brevundimonas phage vB_BpoS-Gurke]|uniref:Trypsin-like peptidase domain protein n=1 Tax=Brevundimonas phage vB_BpoS-Gurke TaxID=2948599 RepID=A0A9E7N441_9CAUD|nr:trypsin-like peptidase domain protein [Brevundimonas phage vB_BpoS-Gurke]
MRRLAAAFSAFLLCLTFPSTLSAPPVQAEPMGLVGRASGPYFVNLNSTGMILCLVLPDGVSADTPLSTLTVLQRLQVRVVTGTGSVIGPGRVLTAAHVVEGAAQCVFQDKPMTPLHFDRALDLAVLAVPLPTPAQLELHCGGLRRGREYLGVGWAYGRDFALQRFTFTGVYADMPLRNASQPALHQAIMSGEAHSGMSGGPVLDGAGRVVGVINVGGPGRGGVRDLSQTPLCGEHPSW